MIWWGYMNFSDSFLLIKEKKLFSYLNIYSMVLLIILIIKYKL